VRDQWKTVEIAGIFFMPGALLTYRVKVL